MWHGTDPENKTKKVPGALRFIKLRVIPDQFYFNIEDVSFIAMSSCMTLLMHCDVIMYFQKACLEDLHTNVNEKYVYIIVTVMKLSE